MRIVIASQFTKAKVQTQLKCSPIRDWMNKAWVGYSIAVTYNNMDESQ